MDRDGKVGGGRRLPEGIWGDLIPGGDDLRAARDWVKAKFFPGRKIRKSVADLSGALLDALAEGRPMSAIEIAAASGVPVRHVYRGMLHLESTGRVIRLVRVESRPAWSRPAQRRIITWSI